jgi:acyl-CoA synthetase (AMP-forming)/AMP-acid ligase II
MTHYRSFTELMLERVAEDPDKPALVLLREQDGQAPPETVTYGELHRSAQALAGWLQQRGAGGKRVLVVQTSRRLFAVSFLACLYAGAVAVPAPPPAGRQHHDRRVASIVKDAAVEMVLTSAAEAAEVSQLLAFAGYGNIPCAAVDALRHTAEWQPPELGEESLAFLQYTSGSTRDPRGVMVRHGNVLHNQQMIAETLRIEHGATIGGWLPFHHDMGLVGQLLQPLWLGGTSVLLSPTAFVKRPAGWLEAISRYRLSVSGAPDFAYELCLRRITEEQAADLDLTCWKIAVTGGEPVRARVLADFAERFACAGLDPAALTPGYGLAEATLMVAGGRPRPPGGGLAPARLIDPSALERHQLREPQPGGPSRALVSSGRPVGGELRIVDPATGQELPEGQVGEIWYRGPSVALGYFGRPAETADTFGGRTASGADGFLRTGDLGVLDGGLLYVTGRLKEMIVSAGRNLYPQDLEHSVQGVSALFGAGSVFAVAGEPEQVVVVQELRARSQYDLDMPALTAAVQRLLVEEFEVRAAAILLVRAGTVRRTTSGKVERTAMRRHFLRGEIDPLHQDADPGIAELLAAGHHP